MYSDSGSGAVASDLDARVLRRQAFPERDSFAARAICAVGFSATRHRDTCGGDERDERKSEEEVELHRGG